MSKSFIAIVTALAAAATLTSAAEAGGGVRLNFGLPLGNFTATPARSGSVVQSYERKAAPRKAAIARAAAAKRAQQKAIAKLHKPQESKSDGHLSETVAAEGASESGPTSTGSLAMIEAETSAKAPAEAEPKVEVDPVTLASAKPDATATEPNADDASPAAASVEQDGRDVAAGEGLKCKKFIPAVGITVSVSCSD